jgi:hypothetical protein
MAIDAQKIGPFPALKVANPFAVNPGLPVFINIAMALTAKPVWLSKSDCFSICQLQFIAVGGVMAIKAPAFLFSVAQFDWCMLILEFSPFGICFQSGMTVAAGLANRGTQMAMTIPIAINDSQRKSFFIDYTYLSGNWIVLPGL